MDLCCQTARIGRSPTQVAEAAGLSRRNVSDFFALKHHEKLAGKGYTGTLFERKEIEIDSKPSSQGQSWFLCVPPEIASAYWLWQVHRGNKAALALCMELITESLERRFGQALGVTYAPTGAKRDSEPASPAARTKYQRDVPG